MAQNRSRKPITDSRPSTDRTGNRTDRSGSKPARTPNKNGSFTREIVIKTDEPDIPLITILKIEHDAVDNTALGCSSISRSINHLLKRRLHSGFSRLIQNVNSDKLILVNANRLANSVKNCQKRLINGAWLRLVSLKAKRSSKNNAARLIFKISLTACQALQAHVFHQCRKMMTRERSLTEEKPRPQKKQQLALATLKTPVYSEEFINICLKMKAYNAKTYLRQILSDLEPKLGKEILRLQRVKSKDDSSNSELVLVVLGNHILTIKNLQKELEQSESKFQQYEKIESQFGEYDNELRNYLLKNKTIDGQEIKKITERQIQSMKKNQSVILYNSRVFLSSLVIKFISEGGSSGPQEDIVFIQSLEELIKITNDLSRLETFRRQHKKKGRSETILHNLAEKFIQNHKVEQKSINEESFLENEEFFATGISTLTMEIETFIKTYERVGGKVPKGGIKSFTQKRGNTAEELVGIQTGVKSLFEIINKQAEADTKTITATGQGEKKKLISRHDKPKPSDSSADNKKIEALILIVKTYKQCLKSGNVENWQKFITSISQQSQKAILKIIDEINDIFCDKIAQAEGSQQAAKYEQIGKDNQRLTSENSDSKKKILELQKKLKELDRNYKSSLEKQRQKSQPSTSPVQSAEYKQLLTKYEKLEQKYQSLEAKNKEKQTKQTTQLSQLRTSKDKLTKQYKSIELKLKKLESELQIGKKNNQKLQEDLEKYKKDSEHFKSEYNKSVSETRKYQLELKKIEVQIHQSSPPQQDQHDILIRENRELAEKNEIMSHQMERMVEQLNLKENQIVSLRRQIAETGFTQSKMESSRHVEESLKRKINFLENTVEDLKIEIEHKNKLLQQFKSNQFLKGATLIDKSREKFEYQAGETMTIIDELNAQLNKIKKSELNLEDINKQLEGIQSRSHHLHSVLESLQVQNSQLRANLRQKDEIIMEQSIKIRELEHQLEIRPQETEQIMQQVRDLKEVLQKSQRHSQSIQSLDSSSKENKDRFIKNLEKIITQNEHTIAALEKQLEEQQAKNEQRAKKHEREVYPEPETPTFVQPFKHSATNLEKKASSIHEQGILVKNLQSQVREWEQKFSREIASKETIIIQLNNEMAIIRGQLAKGNEHQAELIRMKQQVTVLQEQIKKVGDNERRQSQMEIQRLSQEIQRLRGQIASSHRQNQNKNSEIRILNDSIRILQVKIEQSNVQSSSLITVQKELEQKSRLIIELQSQITHQSPSFDNIILLLTNIMSSFFQILPEPQQEQRIEEIRKDIFETLHRIRAETVGNEADYFMRTDNYCVDLIRKDIGKYRVELLERVEQISQLRDRLTQFLNNEIQLTYRKTEVRYGFDAKEMSTNAKTDIKSSEERRRIFDGIEQITQQTIHARRLFDSREHLQ